MCFVVFCVVLRFEGDIKTLGRPTFAWVSDASKDMAGLDTPDASTLSTDWTHLFACDRTNVKHSMQDWMRHGPGIDNWGRSDSIVHVTSGLWDLVWQTDFAARFDSVCLGYNQRREQTVTLLNAIYPLSTDVVPRYVCIHIYSVYIYTVTARSYTYTQRSCRNGIWNAAGTSLTLQELLQVRILSMDWSNSTTHEHTAGGHHQIGD